MIGVESFNGGPEDGDLGQGDGKRCARMLTDLCRAAGIPARVVAGFLQMRAGRQEHIRPHHWTEFHDGYCWRMADCERQRFVVHDEEYLNSRLTGDEETRKEAI
ncbi:MAG TPA: transglutaminase-like domain-containing protein [Kiritimatiellia bacterium]|nr:transglutaminase-like domain-containing protein [Kiritimatiellia bacterium]HRZ13703.1 transglutaminase-like domain-containing protein [Kiritimatiellia bacterium]HSA19389.1 transglutaminase-like domain-containing protein [Kiritimatiellia bacterium]